MSRHLVSTRSGEHPCGRCGTPVHTAWAEGLHVTTDARQLEHEDELAALIAGRLTYTRTTAGELILRTADRIRGGWLRGTIHAQHKCNPKSTQGELF